MTSADEYRPVGKTRGGNPDANLTMKCPAKPSRDDHGLPLVSKPSPSIILLLKPGATHGPLGPCGKSAGQALALSAAISAKKSRLCWSIVALLKASAPYHCGDGCPALGPVLMRRGAPWASVSRGLNQSPCTIRPTPVVKGVPPAIIMPLLRASSCYEKAFAAVVSSSSTSLISPALRPAY